jgi:hypothetical protein
MPEAVLDTPISVSFNLFLYTCQERQPAWPPKCGALQIVVSVPACQPGRQGNSMWQTLILLAGIWKHKPWDFHKKKNKKPVVTILFCHHRSSQYGKQMTCLG